MIPWFRRCDGKMERRRTIVAVSDPRSTRTGSYPRGETTTIEPKTKVMVSVAVTTPPPRLLPRRRRHFCFGTRSGQDNDRNAFLTLGFPQIPSSHGSTRFCRFSCSSRPRVLLLFLVSLPAADRTWPPINPYTPKLANPSLFPLAGMIVSTPFRGLSWRPFPRHEQQSSLK